MAKNAIETAIRNAAANKLANKYRLPQYKKEGTKHNEEYKKVLLHKNVCEQIVAFADSHKDVPFYFILSVGVSKGAYKMSEFDKGYKAFKAEEVEAVAQMGKAYNGYNEQYGKKMTDVTIRLIMRYYEKVSKDYNQFLLDLNNSKKLGKNCGSRHIDYAVLCKNLNIPVTERIETEAA